MADSTGTQAVPGAAGALAALPHAPRLPGAPVAAVILAAGEGSRLGNGSKPLTRVAGVTLLERAGATVRAAGARRVIVVVGHAKEEVARFVAESGLGVELVENDRFRAGNGSSALAGG